MSFWSSNGRFGGVLGLPPQKQIPTTDRQVILIFGGDLHRHGPDMAETCSGIVPLVGQVSWEIVVLEHLIMKSGLR